MVWLYKADGELSDLATRFLFRAQKWFCFHLCFVSCCYSSDHHQVHKRWDFTQERLTRLVIPTRSELAVISRVGPGSRSSSVRLSNTEVMNQTIVGLRWKNFHPLVLKCSCLLSETIFSTKSTIRNIKIFYIREELHVFGLLDHAERKKLVYKMYNNGCKDCK